MDELDNGWDSWLQARLGNAIDVAVDRNRNTSPVLQDAGQAYGMDANGRIYQLGQTNAQITAQVQAAAKPAISPMLILLLIGAVILMEAN